MPSKVALGSSEITISEAEKYVMVPITRKGDLGSTVKAHFATGNDTALAGKDYVQRTGSVTFAPGVDRVVVSVRLIDDKVTEKTESFAFSVTGVDNGVLEAPRTTLVDIRDNEKTAIKPPVPVLKSKYDVTETPVIRGLEGPMGLKFLPTDDSLAYVTEKQGKIKVYDINTGKSVSTLLDICDQVNSHSDRGLMDIALHPDFANNPYIYVFYVVDPPETMGKTGNAGPDGGGNRFSHVVRYTADASTGYTTLVPGSEKVLLGGAGQSLSDISGYGVIDSTANKYIADSSIVNDPNTNRSTYKQDYLKVDSRSHAGGSLAFGPDGALYVSVGDGTSFNAADPRSVSVQSLDSLSGKILRVDPETGQGLSDNPFVGPDLSMDSNRAKVYQLGLRNPFSISFDREGRLLISDTGWSTYEEINTGAPGANFGWPFFEGGDGGVSLPTPRYKDLPAAKAFYEAVDRGQVAVTPAFRAFAHKELAPGFQVQAITAGDVDYSGSKYGKDFTNNYFFSDFSQGEVYSVDLQDRSDVKYLFKTTSGFGPVDFTQGPDGYVYYVNVIDGSIGRLNIADTDRLYGSTGADIMHGGHGNDVYTVNHRGDRVDEAAHCGIDTLRSSVRYTLPANVEKLVLVGVDDINANGNTLANTLTGNTGANILNGRMGKDALHGREGNDVLDGGHGNDNLTGGEGQDTFYFSTRPGPLNLDHIKDFRAIDDTIKLENTGAGLFSQLGKGALQAEEFARITSKSAVVDDDVHILYDKAHGTLYYDPNGGSAAGRVAFAVLDNHASLTFQDFVVT